MICGIQRRNTYWHLPKEKIENRRVNTAEKLKTENKGRKRKTNRRTVKNGRKENSAKKKEQKKQQKQKRRH